MPPLKRYTDRELDFVAAALEAGATKTQIAAFFGMTLSALHALRMRYGLTLPSAPSVDIDALGSKFGLISHQRKQEAIQGALDNLTNKG